MRRLIYLTVLLAACAPNTPDGVARRYAHAAEKGDADAIAKWIDPRCTDAPIGRGAPFHLLGMPTEVKDLALTVTDQKPDKATVHYSYQGVVDAKSADHDLEVFGKDVKVTTGPVHAEVDHMSGDLRLMQIDGHWRVTCALAGLR